MAAPMHHILNRFRITTGGDFRLKDFHPSDTCGHLLSREQAEKMVAEDVERLSKLHDRLYALNEWALLCVFQAMDAGGKDSTIKHVMTGVNPQGVQVTSFKVPGPEELAHDFLWRINRALPERGSIGIFNRSH
ncbi:MAG TPA: polyphosphate kinase 2 family protein, partial [Acetobacteraceae bacterium]|nr:polyphosphate kinase 2 family protein [Acetobacteraceae bacterium]